MCPVLWQMSWFLYPRHSVTRISSQVTIYSTVGVRVPVHITASLDDINIFPARPDTRKYVDFSSEL